MTTDAKSIDYCNSVDAGEMSVDQEPMTAGYAYEWIEEPPDDLKCQICLGVARDPHQHGNGGCGRMFCESCVIEHVMRTDRKCPNCRTRLVTFKDERSEYVCM